MFGYVRPLKGELRVREYEQFKAVYCGLCHTLKQKYGLAARFIINYDFTFMALLLTNGDIVPEYCRKRCIVSPLRKKSCACISAGLERCAAESVVLAWWKLRDTLDDAPLYKKAAAWLGRVFLRRAYKKAAEDCRDFEQTVKQRLGELSELERDKCDSIDRTADRFADILRSAAVSEDVKTQRVMSELLYHLGRWIYITDALDDLREDAEKGCYNPIIYRFSLPDGGKLTEEDREYIRTTLEHSCSICALAMELLPKGCYSPIIENVVYLGLPWITQQVVSGQWRQKRK